MKIHVGLMPCRSLGFHLTLKVADGLNGMPWLAFQL